MRIIISYIVLFCSLASASFVEDSLNEIKQVHAIHKQILKNTRGTLDSIPLATLIVSRSSEFGINSRLFTALLAVESMYKVDAINQKSNDFGIAQINIENIKTYRMNKDRLLYDVDYSITMGLMILKWFKLRYEKREPKTWMCRYNIGTQTSKRSKRKCLRYLRKLRRYL